MKVQSEDGLMGGGSPRCSEAPAPAPAPHFEPGYAHSGMSQLWLLALVVLGSLGPFMPWAAPSGSISGSQNPEDSGVSDLQPSCSLPLARVLASHQEASPRLTTTWQPACWLSRLGVPLIGECPLIHVSPCMSLYLGVCLCPPMWSVCVIISHDPGVKGSLLPF